MAKLRSPLVARKKSPPLGLIRSCSGWFLLAGKFREKYAQSLGAMSFEQWRSTFSQPLLIHVNRIIAWTRTTAGVAYRVVP